MVQDRLGVFLFLVFFLISPSQSPARGERDPPPKNRTIMFYPIMVPQFGQLESFLLEFKPVSPGLGFCCHSDKMFSNHYLKTIMNLTLTFFVFCCYIKQLSFLHLFFLINLFILFLAALGLHSCTRAFSSCGKRELLRCGMRASHCGGLSRCGARALGMQAQ